MPSQKSGFTLIEATVVFAIIALVALIATPFLLGTREKAALTNSMDRLTSTLELAQQQSIAAFEGQQFSVRLRPSQDQYVYEPDGRIYNLLPDIKIVEPSSETVITFAKLTGRPESATTIVLQSKKFEGSIVIEEGGSIFQGSIERY